MTQAVSPASEAANLVAQNILDRLKRLRLAETSSHVARPLIVSMQGPQGVGKSTIAALLVGILSRHATRCVVASLDDFYLTHAGLDDLARKNPDNTLLHGRGQPGTHDVGLLVDVLGKVRRGQKAHLPVFDKSLFNGEGDRAEASISVDPPVDVFVLEGWSMGFQPLSPAQLENTYSQASRSPPTPAPLFLSHTLESLSTVNTNLASFAQHVYPLFDTHVSLRASSRSHIYTWRREQEHAMKAKNGGRGMSDDQVRRFVDRYMPGYELFEAGMLDQWAGRAYIVSVGADRSVVDHHAI